MTGRSRLPGGEPRKAGQRNKRNTVLAKATPVWRASMPVLWKGRAAVFRREVGDGEHARLLSRDGSTEFVSATSGYHRSETIRSACTSRSIVSRKSLSPRISDNSAPICSSASGSTCALNTFATSRTAASDKAITIPYASWRRARLKEKPGRGIALPTPGPESFAAGSYLPNFEDPAAPHLIENEL